jgi:hypothetical protein
MHRYLTLAAASLAAGLLADRADAQITYNLDSRPTAISNLVIGGLGTYDVTIDYLTTFGALFGSGDPPNTQVPAFWGSSTNALAAATAIASALSGTGPGREFPDPNEAYVMVPYQYESGAATDVDTHAAYYPGSGTSYTGLSGSVPVGDPYIERGFARFTLTGPAPVIPEPGTFALLGTLLTGISACGWWRRRRGAIPSSTPRGSA